MSTRPSTIAIGAAAASAAVVAAFVATRKRKDKWETMLESVTPAIVVIKMNYVKPYDGDQAGSGVATGFVVRLAAIPWPG